MGGGDELEELWPDVGDALRCDAWTGDEAGYHWPCTLAAGARFAVRWDRDKPEEVLNLCGVHVRSYRGAGARIRFLRVARRRRV